MVAGFYSSNKWFNGNGLTFQTKLRMENEDLKERISAGASEYAKLLDRYKMLKSRQEFPAFNNLNNELMKLRQAENLIHLSQPLRNSTTPSEDNDVDSAFQDKTPSHATAVSTADIENTLLDALLGSSLYNGASWGAHNQDGVSGSSSSQLAELQQQLNQLASATAAAVAASQPTTPTLIPNAQILMPTTIQPSKISPAARSIVTNQVQSSNMLNEDLTNLIDLKTNLTKTTPPSSGVLSSDADKDEESSQTNVLTHRKKHHREHAEK